LTKLPLKVPGCLVVVAAPEASAAVVAAAVVAAAVVAEAVVAAAVVTAAVVAAPEASAAVVEAASASITHLLGGGLDCSNPAPGRALGWLKKSFRPCVSLVQLRLPSTERRR
jgi:hypothetical protein